MLRVSKLNTILKAEDSTKRKVEISVIKELWHSIYKDNKGLINIAKNIMKVQNEIFGLFTSSRKKGKRKVNHRDKMLRRT